MYCQKNSIYNFLNLTFYRTFNLPLPLTGKANILLSPWDTSEGREELTGDEEILPEGR